MEGQAFYKWLSEVPAYKTAVEEINDDLVYEIQNTVSSSYKFRPYQKQALMAFDWIVSCAVKGDSVISQLIEEDKCGNVPIFGFESATGSGKTLLIGAFITYLHLKHDIKNFLILTPPRGKSAIYDKTIKNFDLNEKSCVLSNSFEKKYNLVTGENYIDKSSNYQDDADFNVFVFNINKFFESSAGIKSVDKPWEESFWKDSTDNVISFRKYLSQLDDLVIITDESHHFQKFNASGDEVSSGRGNSAGDIVKDLNPKYLVEFTATMAEGQKPIYRYPVNQYISDGYGKKVRAWGINTNVETGIWEYDAEVIEKQKEVTDSDASKIVRAIAVHLIKKIALGYNVDKSNKKLKPILLIKARNTDHADNILTYLQEKLPVKEDAIKKIYQQILIDNEYEINKLIEENIPSGDILVKELEEIGSLSFAFHTKNETKEILDLFNGLEGNDMELIIQVDKATEGWNIDNVYTILILSNNEGDIKTNVKQLVGRGLRLLRENRIYDESEDKLKQEEEILHIICEQGNNFAKFVEDVRKEIGFNSENFSGNRKVESLNNEIIILDIMKYNDLTLPKIERDSEPTIDSPEELIQKLTFENLQLDSFAKEVSAPWPHGKTNEMLLKWPEQDYGKEVDLTTGTMVKEGLSEYMEEELLTLSEIERTKIIKNIIKNQNLLPSDEAVDCALRNAIRDLTDKYVFYFKRKYGSNDFWSRNFSNGLSNYISKKIDLYFEVKTVVDETEYFKDIFQEHILNIEYDNSRATNIKTKEQIHDLLSVNKKEIPKYFVSGYIKSYFKYSKFDSSQEVKMAEMLDSLEEVDVWVKNKRHGQFIIKYGLGKNFSPDFIVKLKDCNKVHILEIKGEGFKESSTDKIEVMNDANKISNNKYHCYFLLHTTVDNLFDGTVSNFNDIISKDDLDRVLLKTHL